MGYRLVRSVFHRKAKRIINRAICSLAYGEFAVVEQGGFQLGEEFVLEPLRL